MTKSRLNWLLAVLAASPCVGAWILIRKFGANFHWWDEWAPGLAGLFGAAAHGQILWGEVFSLHNEHRIVIPRLIYLLLNPITHWNNLGNLYFAWGMVCVTSLMVLMLLIRTTTERSGGGARVWSIWFLCNLLIFTPVQLENWLWGMGLVNFTPTLFLFAAFWAAVSGLGAWKRVWICLLLSALATYSSGNGVLAWPLVGIVLAERALDEPATEWKKKLLVWIAGALVFIGLYYIHYSRPGGGTERGYQADLPTIALHHLAFEGNPLAYGTTFPLVASAITIGSVLLALLGCSVAYFVRARLGGNRELCRRMILWFAVAGYGIASGMIASYFRAGFGVEQALSFRYATYAIWLPVALINLIPMIADDIRRTWPACLAAAMLPSMLAGALVLLQVMVFPISFIASQTVHARRLQGKGELLLANILPDNPLITLDLWDEPGQMVSEADILNQVGYLQPGLIATNNAAELEASGPGSRGPVAGRMDGARQTGPSEWTLEGWAVYPNTKGLVDDIIITYQDEADRPIIVATAQMNLARKDVADQTGVPEFIHSGWIVKLNPARVPASMKTVRFRAWALDTDNDQVQPLEAGVMLNR